MNAKIIPGWLTLEYINKGYNIYSNTLFYSMFITFIVNTKLSGVQVTFARLLSITWLYEFDVEVMTALDIIVCWLSQNQHKSAIRNRLTSGGFSLC